MKRIAAFVFCILLLGVLAIPVSAEGSTQIAIVPSSTTAKPGDEITFTVTISGGDACTSFGMLLEFDASVYEVVGGECTAEGSLLKIFEPDKGFAVMYQNETVPSGTVGTFTLKVKADTASGISAVSGQPSVKNRDTAVSAAVTAANVKISGGTSQNAASGQTGQQTEVPAPTQAASAANQAAPAATQTDAGESEQTEAAPNAGTAADGAAVAAETGEEIAVPEADDVPVENSGILILLVVLIAAAAVCACVLLAVIKGGKKRRK